MKKKPPSRQARRPLLEELERRILLSADVHSALLDPSLADPAAAAQPRAQVAPVEHEETPAAAVQALRHELVFVDTGVEGYEALVQDLRSARPDGRALEVILLEPGRDGVEQITEALADHEGLDAIHIVSHGADGVLRLGSTTLSTANLDAYARDVARWGDALSLEGDLLLYGCDVAADGAGKAFVESLAKLTGADVAASTDATGHALLGGDWELEERTGAIETTVTISLPAQKSWFGVLDTATLQAVQDTDIKLKSPTDTYNYGVTPSLVVDRESTDLQRALFKFDLSSIPTNATVTSATLKLQATQIGGTLNISVYELLEDWSEGTQNGTAGASNWSQRMTGTNWTTAGSTYNSTAVANLNTNTTGQHTWNVTTLVQDWVDGTKVNNGLLVASPDGGGNRTVTYDSREGTTKPVLEIIYTVPANTAPVLDASKSPALGAINEDAGAPSGAVGTLVSALVDFASPSGQVDNVTDPDAGALLGIAVTAADTSNGSWFYSTNNGSSWTPLGAVSNASARLLAADANTRLYFQPNANYNGTLSSAITLRAWDQSPSSGTNGGLADTSTNGGTTAFSTQTDTASLVITAVNDAPTATITPASYSATEQVALTLHGTGLSIADVDAGTNGVQATVSVVSGTITAGAGGTGVSISGNGTSSVTLSGTLTQINNLLAGASSGTLTYTINSDAPPASDTLTLTASDLGNTGSGGTLTGSDTATINITALNDPPLLAGIEGATLSYTENAVATAITSTVTLSDVDNANMTGARVLITGNYVNGEDLLSFTNTGSITGSWDSATASLTLTGADTVANYQAALRAVKYSNSSDDPSTAVRTVSFTAYDGAAYSNIVTRNIAVTAVNDAPSATITPASYSATEQTTLTLHGTGLSVADVDANSSSVTTTVSVTSGTLSAAAGTTGVGLAGSGTATVTLTGTLVQINDLLAGNLSGTLTYINASDTPPASATLTLSVNDGGNTGTGGALAGSDTATINLTAVNDAPLHTVPGAQSTSEDTALVFSSGNGNLISIGDVDAGSGSVNVLLSVTTGTLTLNGTSGLSFITGDGSADALMNFTGTLANINAALNGLSFIPAADFSGGATLQIITGDQGNTGTGGALADSDTVAITVNAVNDPPLNSVPGTQLAREGLPLVFNAGNGNLISIGDVDAGANPVQVTLTGGSGTATLSGTAGLSFTTGDGTADATMTFTGTVADINAALDGLSFTATPNLSGGASLQITTNDQGNTGAGGALSDTDTITIDVAGFVVTPVSGLSTSEGGGTAAFSVVLRSAPAADVTIALSVSNPAEGSLSTPALTFTAANWSTPQTVIVTGLDDNIVDGSVSQSVLTATASSADANYNGLDPANVALTNIDNDAAGILVTPVSVTPLGGEVLVNTTTADIQSIVPNVMQAVATDASGNFVVVWTSNLQDGSAYGVYAQRFSADGTAQGAEFRVNTTTADNQINAAVAMDDAGNFVVTWSSNLQDGSGYGIYAQRYDAAGVAQGSEFLVNSTTAGSQTTPSVAMAPTGAFVITWTGGGQDPDASSGVFAQRFDASGVAQGGEFRVNTYTTDTQQLCSVSMDAAGNFVVIWVSNLQDGSGYGVYGQRFDAAGNAQGSEFRVNTTTVDSQLYHDVTMLSDGRFVVAYQGRSGASYEVYLQRYAANGTPIGGETRVNTVTVTGFQPIPSVSADAGGHITVVWNSSADGAGAGVIGRRFDWTGTAVGAEFQVNTTTAGNQLYAEVVAQPGGRFVVAWGGNGPGDADGVFLQRYGLETTEAGGTATFSVVLASQPSADVTIPIATGNGTEGTPSTSSLTFTTANWNVAQTVTVTGLQDFVTDGDVAYSIVTAAVTSADAAYAGQNPADVVIINREGPNAAPLNTVPGAQSVNEDSSLVFSSGNGNAIAISDADAGSNPVQVTLTAANGTLTLAGTAGLSFSTGDGSADATMTFTGTVAAINTALGGLAFAPTANFSGAASLDIVTNDQGNSGTGGAQSDTDTVSITVNAVNDAPAISAPASIPVTEDVASPLTGISFSDIDAGASDVQVTLSVDSGSLAASSGGGVSIGITPSELILTGSLANINAFIAGGSLTFTTDPDATATATLSITISDQGHTGSGGAQSASTSVALDVAAVNDAPAHSVPGPQSTPEDTALVFSTGNGNAIVVSDVDAGGNPVRVTLTATQGTLTLASTVGLVFSTGDGSSDATMTFTGTVAVINGALDGLSFAPAADYHGAASVEISTNDQGWSGSGGAQSATDSIAITVTPVNDAPVVNDQSFSVAENSANGTVVGTVVATDVDAGDTRTFSITGGNTGGALSIDASTGEITVASTAALDFETTPTFTLTVEVEDAAGLTDTATITISLSNVNEAPVVNDQSFSLAENSASGTVVGSVAATDVDAGDIRSFSITGGNTGGAFTIDSSTGEITVASAAALDFETTPSFTLTVEVEDAAGLTDTATITISLTNVNEAPVVNDQSFSVAESSANGTVVGTVAASDVDAGDTRTFSITGGNTGGAFTIDSSTGEITVASAAALDFETTPSFTLTVEVEDAAGLTDTATVTVSLTNVNEAPVVNDQSFSVAESSANGTVVGTVAASDVDAGDTRTFSITGGNTGGAFSIDSSTGEITVASTAALDFETTPSFALTVEVEDAAGLTDTAAITVSLTNVNEAPVVNDQSFSVAENSANGTVVGTVAATDVDAGDTRTFSITGGNTGSAFAIDASTGEITVASSAALDFETTPSFTLTVEVEDAAGLTDTATITVSLTNVNEAPVVNDQAFSVAENSANGTVVGVVAASDVDAGDTRAFSITGGNTGSAFAIDASTGEITVASTAALDFETTPTFTLTVEVEDAAGLTDTATITISLTNVNEAPVVNDQAFSVAENSANGTVVGTVAASDVDAGDTRTFSITGGNTGGALSIDASTGEITVASAAALDFETTPSFTLTVEVEDAAGLTDTATITVSLNNVNEAPVVNDQSFSVAENSTNGTIVGSVVASDVDAADSRTFSITGGNTGGAFTIDSSTGEITVASAAALDFETTPSFTLTVEVEDAAGLTDTATVTVSLTNVNEAPVVNDQSFSVAESSANGTVVGTVAASDVDAGDTRTFSITGGNTGGALSIDASTGEITVASAAALDFETTPSFTLTVEVEDAAGLTDTATVTISLSNVNEAPVVNDQAFSVAESSANGTVVGSVAASDVDAADTRTFSITGGNTGGAFTIDSSTGEITVASTAALDFETTPSFTLTVEVEDAAGLTDTATVTISLTNVNEAPVVNDQAFSVAENSANGTVVGSVVASDVDAGDTRTFSITGGNTGGAFTIDASTGEITVASAAALDFETTPSFTLTVEVEDAAGLTDTATITVSLTNVNEAPVVNDQAFSVAENSANGTVVGSVAASDVDAGDTRTFSITGGNTGGAFSIDASTGEITVASAAALDFETTPSFTLTVEVEDAAGLTDTATITVSLTNVNEAPVVNDQAFSVAENSANGTVVGSVAASDVDAGDTRTFSITGGNTGGAFTIDATTGQITVASAAALDFETTPSFTLTVEVEDAAGLTDTATITVSLTNVNEAPVVNDQAFSVLENSANGTVVGTVAASDVDAGDTRIFSITGGNTGGAFSINASTGEITVASAAALDFETTPSFTLTVEVEDAAGLTDTATITVSLTNVNEAPVVNDQAFSVAENSANGTVVGSVAASDVDAGDTRTFSITGGNTGGAFSIDSSTGEITVASTAALDFETTPSFALTVEVEDAAGLTDTATITVSLTNVNEAPVVNDQAFSVLENSANGTVVGTVAASDVDAGDTRIFSITGGNTGGAFTIDSSTGEITVASAAALDFETTPIFTLTVEVEDAAGLTDTATITVSLTNVNEAPVVNDQAFSVAENSANGTVVGSVAASDVDAGDTRIFSITAGNTGGAFSIDSSTGEVTVANAAALDFETTPSFALTVQVQDAGGLTDTATITVSLTNVNEAPVVNDQAFSVAENSANGTVVGSVAASDVDAGDTRTFSITGGNTGGAFTIDATTGQITVASAAALDFETTPSFTLTVEVEDAAGLTDTATITVSLTNVNEAPVVNDQAFSVAENSANGTVVGVVAASDVDAADTRTFSITGGNTGGAFTIDSSTGEITVASAAALDFETTPSFTLTVEVEDAAGLTDTATITISLTNVNEAPVVNDQAFSVAENSANGTVVGVVAASDVDAGDTRAFSITGGNTGSAFAIDASTGEITVASSAALDFETTPSFTLTVEVEDAAGLTDTATITISLSNVNEAPVVNDQSFSLAENSASGTVVGSVAATDVDAGDIRSFSITGGNTGGAFTIDSSTGEITVASAAALDFETTPTVTLTVEVEDAAGLTDTATVTVSLTNVNEAPVVNDQSFSVAESSANGTVVGTVAASDVDAGDTRTFSITGGNTGGAFTIDASTGEITVASAAALDFETTPTFTLTVEVEDAAGLTDTAAITVSLTNVNEAPVVNDQSFSVAESSANGTVVGTVAASDVDAGDTRTFSITAGNTGSAFTIDSSTGEITVASTAALDFETTPSFTLTVEVEDAAGLTDTATVTISLTNVNEAPVVNDQAFSVAENSANGTVVGVVAASDVDAPDSRTFSITGGNTGGAFTIDSSTGEITVASAAALDFETTPTFTLTVEVEDAAGLTDTATMTISLTNVNEAPVVNDQAFSVAENSANGTVVGTVAASDVDAGDTRTFSITGGNTGGAFTIDSSTGEITVASAAALDFETTPSFTLTVEVEDAAGLTDTATVTVSLTNVNEAPVVNDQAFSVAENSANGTVVGTVAASDVDAGDTRTFSITGGNTGGALSIDASTGEITVASAAALDFETTPSFTLTVEVEDAAGLTDTATVTISLTNVNEAPVVNDQSFSVAENSANGTVVGTVAASDVDAGDTRTFSITGGNTGGAFTIDSNTGEITVASAVALDFETTPSFTLTVQVLDAGGLTDTATITVSLNNVNEAPVVNDQSFSVAENSANGTVVGTVAASDVDAGDTRTFSITAGNTGGAFTIDASTGEITVASAAALDFETTPSFTLTVEVEDAAGLTDTATITVSLTNANEAPSITAPGPQVTDEDTALVFSTAGGNPLGIVDVDAGTSPVEVTLTATQGRLSLSGSSGLTFSAGDGSDDATMSFTGSVTDVNAALDGLVFTPAADYHGAATLQIAISDQGYTGSGGALSAVRSVDVTMLAVNDAPVLDPSASMTLTPVAQDVTNPAGNTITSILASAGGSPLTDVDGGGALGVAVVAVDDTHGAWQYSTDGGASWLAFASVSDSSAVLLDASARVRFVPASGYSGAAGSITIRGWDGTSGASGAAGIDVAVNGGTSAFSAATGTATIEVQAPGDPIFPPDDPPGPDPEPPPPDDGPPGGDPVPDPIGVQPPVVPGAPPTPGVTPAAPSSSGDWLRSSGAGAAGAGAAAVGDTQERDHSGAEASELEHNPLKATGLQALMQALDQLRSEMGDDAARELRKQLMMISATEAAALVTSAGLIAAVLRGGSLLAFALSSLPLWRQADPLAVLALSDEEREKREEELRKARREEERRARGLDRLFGEDEPRDRRGDPPDAAASD